MSHRIFTDHTYGSCILSPAKLFLGMIVLLLTWNTGWSQAPGTIITIAGDGNTTFAGDGGPATLASLNAPSDIEIDASGIIYITDFSNGRIRRIDTNGIITTIAGTGNTTFSGDNGPATQAGMLPGGMNRDALGNFYFMDGTNNPRVRRIDVNGIITTIAGTGVGGNTGDEGPATLATFSSPQDYATDGNGNLYISDAGSQQSRVRRVDLSTGIIHAFSLNNGGSGFSGDGGHVSQAALAGPIGLWYDTGGNRLLIADFDNHRIRTVDLSTGIINTIAGSGPTGSGNGSFSGDGGPATQARTNRPTHVMADVAGNVFFTGHNRVIRKVDAATGIITTIAGTGVAEYSGDGGPATLAGINSFAQGMAVDSQGNLYIVAAGSSRIRKVFGVAAPSQPPPGTVTVKADTAFGAPGDTLRISTTMTNPTTSPVGGLQFSVILGNTTEAHFIGLEDTTSNPGFTVWTNTAGDSTRLVIYSISGDVIPPGSAIPLATLVYVLDPSATLGNTAPLTLVDVAVADSFGIQLDDSTVDGELQVGIRGDVDLDGQIFIMDIIRTVRIILGKDAMPDSGSVSFNIADMNANGTIDVADVVLQVNTILGITTKQLVSGPTSPVVVNLAVSQSGDQFMIPVMLDANGVIAGMQAEFTFDPSLLEVGTPQLVGTAVDLAFDYHVIDGMLRVVVYGMTPGQGIASGHSAMLHIPVTVREGITGNPSLTLADIILVNPQAQRVPVQLGEITVSVTKEGSTVPTSFSLGEARPNPFNPSTTISYEVPQESHIRMVVYNLLGQEVVRLIDEIKSPGRYTVTWNGMNVQGRGVASGIYVYRMTAGDFTRTKRMTLLK